MKKYKLIKNDTVQVQGKTLYRIEALRDFGDINKGYLGGYIESEDNLSHDGNTWVYGNAKVYGNARVFNNARVYDDARLYNNARVYGDAWVFNNARVYGNARVFGIARVYGNARMFGNAQVNKKYIYNRIISSSFEVTWFDKPVILHYYEKEEK